MVRRAKGTQSTESDLVDGESVHRFYEEKAETGRVSYVYTQSLD